MIIKTIVVPKDFNLLFGNGLCLVGAVALTDTLQERSVGLYHVSGRLEEGRVLDVFLDSHAHAGICPENPLCP